MDSHALPGFVPVLVIQHNLSGFRSEMEKSINSDIKLELTMSDITIKKIGGKVPDKPPPMFEHDCKECVYLGHVTINGREADIGLR